jgi:transcriptional regulator with XRE-family HTH domain
LGWKQSELARRVGVGDTTVSRWATGAAIPEPVAAYLGLAAEIDRLHRQYVRPIKPPKRETAELPANARSIGRQERRDFAKTLVKAAFMERQKSDEARRARKRALKEAARIELQKSDLFPPETE